MTERLQWEKPTRCTSAHAPLIGIRRWPLTGAADAEVGMKKATVDIVATTMAREARNRILSPKLSDLAES
jgi:hypothetical protein